MISPKTSISVWSLQQLSLRDGQSLDDVLETIASLGVDYVEINEDHLNLPPYQGRDGAKRLCRRVEGLGLKVSSVWFYTDLLSAVHVTSVATVVDQLADDLALAAALGARFMTIPPGDGWPGIEQEAGHGTFCKIFDRVLPIARDYGVIVGLEIGRASGRFHTPDYALRLVEHVGSLDLRIVPDFEAWRLPTPDLPLSHVETQGELTAEPADLTLFERCLRYAPFVHAKLLRLDENGEEPHFPIAPMMAAMRDSSVKHLLNIEYEGWIPDVDPHLDCIEESRRCLDLVKRYSAI